jgi:hypothetical protein
VEAYRVEMLRIPHCLDGDVGKVVNPKHRPRSTPQKHYFCQTLSEPQGLVRPEGLGKLKKILYIECALCNRKKLLQNSLCTGKHLESCTRDALADLDAKRELATSVRF